MAFAGTAKEAADGRRRAGDHDRVEGLPRPDFDAAQGRAQGAGDLRRPQPLRARRWCARQGFEYYPIGRAGRQMSAAKLPDFSRTRVLVVGDVMLDRYWFGDVSRISPEAPVPVVLVQRTEERPGGAANVARNITALGRQAPRCSRSWATTKRARTLERLLAAEHVQASLHRDAALSTTVKLRVIGQQQQLLRIDFERAPSHEVLAAKLDDFERLVDAGRRRGPLRLRQGRARARDAHDRGRKAARQARARRSEGRRVRALPRRHAAHAQPLGVPRGGGALERRGGFRAPGAEAARRPRPRSAHRHAQRGGHVALHRQGVAGTSPRGRARSTT